MGKKRPKYEEIAQNLIDKIESGKLPAGAKLPSDAELTVEFSVSRQTILNALGQLKAKGLVTRAPGAGTFVRDRSTPVSKVLLLEFGMQQEMASNPVDLALVNRIEAALENSACELSLKMVNALPGAPVEADKLQAAMGDGWDGVLLLCHWPAEGLVEFLRGLDIPVVSLVQEYKGTNISSVVADNRAGASSAVQYLLALGHRRIAFATWPEKYWGQEARARLEGYQAALEEFGVPVDPDLVVTPELESGDLPDKLGALRQLSSPPTALLCVNDRLALVAISVLNNQFGLSLPADMNLIGFGGFRSDAGIVSPALTTVHVPWLELAACGAELLIEHITSESEPGKTVTLDTKLVKRESCGPGPYWPGKHAQ